MFASIPASGASIKDGLPITAPGIGFVRLPTFLERSTSTNVSMSSSDENMGGMCAAFTNKLASSLSYSPSPAHLVRATRGYLSSCQFPLPVAPHNKPRMHCMALVDCRLLNLLHIFAEQHAAAAS